MPRRVVELYEAVTSKGLVDGRAVHQELFELNRAVFYDTNPIPVKYMMWRLGILPGNEHRLPMVPASADVAARLDALLVNAGLLDRR